MSIAAVPEKPLVAPGTRKSPLRMAAAACMLAIGVCILAFAMSGSNASNRDFVCYWAAGHQLVNHGNPYDGAAILRLERQAGFTDSRPFFMRNPPIAFFMAWPLGFVGIRAGAVLWSLALVGALMISIRLLWTIHGRPADRMHLVGYCFAPVLACLLAGQIGILLLLGVVLFLRFHQTRPTLAGMSLLLCALKPHLFFPFAVVLCMWAIRGRAYRMFIGAAGATAGTLCFSFLLDRAAWQHYAAMAAQARLQDEFIPTLSLMLRLLVHRQAVWLQFVPAAVACAWAAWFFMKHRTYWDWMEHGSLLMLVSILVAPYAWFSDQAVLLPALFDALYRQMRTGGALFPFTCAMGLSLLQVLAGTGIGSAFYLWTAPAWLALWLMSNARKSQISSLSEVSQGHSA
jgi:hypothetical protein